MIKRICLAVALLIVMAVVPAKSQQVGSWSIYPVFSGNNNNSLVDTDNKVFYLADGWLYSYDKDNDESVFYTKMNGMSDTDISGIYYNYDKKFLLVAYSNSNIDIVRENGRVDNVPDLKSVILTVSKAINSVDFSGDYAYIATDFGYMVVDCNKCVVKESFNYGKAFKSIVVTDKNIFATFDKKIYVSSVGESHYELSSFKETNIKQEMHLRKIDNNSMLTTTGWFYYIKIGEDPTNLAMSVIEKSAPSNVSMSGSNMVASYREKYIVVSPDGTSQTVAMPSEIDGSHLSTIDGKGLWNLDSNGLKEFSISDGSVTILHDTYRPNTSTVSEPYYLTYQNGTLYSMNSGRNYKGASNGKSVMLSSLKNGVWNKLNPIKVDIHNNSYKSLIEPYGMAIDPFDSEKIWFGSFFEGIYCVKNGEQVQKIDHLNSPMYLDFVVCVSDLKFDKEGNLWFSFYNFNKTTYAPLYILPKDKLYKENLTADDFISIDLGNFATTYGSQLCISKDGRYVLLASNMWKSKLAIIDTNGTLTDISDDRVAIVTTYNDQDGKNFDIGYIHSIKEENNKFWLGTNTGVGLINNIKAAFSGNLVVNRVKVPRNDGTNLADYLLDGVYVYNIAIDGANRKWFGSSTSGLYLTSSDGSEILEHFSTENSPLTSDEITSVACSTDDNRVFIGTKKGTLVYESDAAPSQDDYSDVYAYPNPVRPDYSGHITVAGLMDNSLVKITDSMGNLVYSGRSTGGMFVWNGLNSEGSRVNTGVYYVFASQNESDKSSGCVTKILVVK